MTVNRSLDLAHARAQIGEMEESPVTMEVHSELQKNFDDAQSRLRELELALVTEESKVSGAETTMKRLREELEEKVQVAQESEAQAVVEETFLTNRVAQLTSDLEKMRGQVESPKSRAAAAEAKVGVAEAWPWRLYTWSGVIIGQWISRSCTILAYWPVLRPSWPPKSPPKLKPNWLSRRVGFPKPT